MTASLRDTIRNRQPAIAFFFTLPGTVAPEKVAALGFDFLVIDMQHGQADYSDALAIITAINAQGGIAFVRPPSHEPGLIGRVLDAGARGIIVPMVNDAEQARRIVAACRYAPLGDRSYGPLRSSMYIGPEPKIVNDDITCIVMLETPTAVANAEEIARVPGIDALMAGPSDLAISHGLPRGSDGVPLFEEALAKISAAAAAAGIGAGIPCGPEIVGQRMSEGWTFANVGNDVSEIVAGAARYVEGFKKIVETGGAKDGAGGLEPRLASDA